MIMSVEKFFLLLGIIIAIGAFIAFKYADYEQRKKHGKM